MVIIEALFKGFTFQQHEAVFCTDGKQDSHVMIHELLRAAPVH